MSSLDLDAAVGLHQHSHIEDGFDRADIIVGVAVRIEVAVTHHARIVTLRAERVEEWDNALGAGSVAFVTAPWSVSFNLDTEPFEVVHIAGENWLLAA